MKLSCMSFISTHAPAGGATLQSSTSPQTERFLLTPLREGRLKNRCNPALETGFLLTPLREGRRTITFEFSAPVYFYSRPCGRGDYQRNCILRRRKDFYSRPCGRGDLCGYRRCNPCRAISTHAPAGGATRRLHGRRTWAGLYFYSRPCGRGDDAGRAQEPMRFSFLLTPLREGRQKLCRAASVGVEISTHAPAGGATRPKPLPSFLSYISTHAPAGGATAVPIDYNDFFRDFYSRPCGRGDAGP